MKRVDACTYDLGHGYYAERMADGSWTAYRPIPEAGDRYLWAWSSPKHSTRQSAQRAVGWHRRQVSTGGK